MTTHQTTSRHIHELTRLP